VYASIHATILRRLVLLAMRRCEIWCSWTPSINLRLKKEKKKKEKKKKEKKEEKEDSHEKDTDVDAKSEKKNVLGIVD